MRKIVLDSGCSVHIDSGQVLASDPAELSIIVPPSRLYRPICVVCNNTSLASCADFFCLTLGLNFSESDRNVESSILIRDWSMFEDLL